VHGGDGHDRNDAYRVNGDESCVFVV
jgi:hypothetical protein